MTLRQRKAIANILENRGKSISGAMLKAGYDPTTAKNPKNLTESKGFKELLATELKDTILIQKHREALDANKQDQFTGEWNPDHQIRLKAVELGYKLKRYIGPEVMQQLNVGGDMTLEFIHDEK